MRQSILWIIGFGIFSSGVCFALPFNITPNGTLPTSVASGSSTTASYIVQNNTLVQRNNNFVKYLPPHVTVDTSSGCAANFNLGAKGTNADSCILNLIISGPVNAEDPKTHHHLFICFSGGITCAGPSQKNSLNVVLTPPLPPPPPPPLSGFYQLNKVACDTAGLQCTAVGIISTLDALLPLSYTSSNGGISWSLSNISTPSPTPPNNNAELAAVACDASHVHCTTIGNYFNGSNNLPVSYISLNGGVSWSLSSTLPPAQNGDSLLSDLNCSPNGLACTLVGDFFDGGTASPIGYTTNDGGNLNWTVSTFPASPDFTNLNGVACDSNHLICTAVGYRADSSGTPHTVPLTYVSNNGGATWNNSTTPPPPQSLLNHQLLGVSCSSNGLNCVTVGRYFNGSQNTPITYISTDGGNNWAVSAVLPQPIGNLFDTLFNVSCNSSGTICTAVGGYSANSTLLASSYLSNDGGNTWALSSSLPAPQDGSGNRFTGIDCNDTGRCVIAGSIQYASSFTSKPFAFRSLNAGNTWIASNPFPLPN